MAKHYVTFGSDHSHEFNGIKVGYTTVAVFDAKDATEGRKKAFKYFGKKFCFEYSEIFWREESMRYYPGGYVNIPEDWTPWQKKSDGKKIFRYPLEKAKRQEVKMPKNALILSVGEQRGDLFLWAIVKENEPAESRVIDIHATGDPLPEEPQLFLGRVEFQGGSLVFHVFESIVK